NGWFDGATTARPSETSGPRSHVSFSAAGSVAVTGMLPILKFTDAFGSSGTNVPCGGAAEVIAKLPPFAPAFTETTAKRIESSGQRTFTSVCVGSVPTCTALAAAPCGRARPKVAQPGPSV